MMPDQDSSAASAFACALIQCAPAGVQYSLLDAYILFHPLSSSELKSAGSSVQVLYLCGRAEVWTVTAAGTDLCGIALIWLVSSSSFQHQLQPPNVRQGSCHLCRRELHCAWTQFSLFLPSRGLVVSKEYAWLIFPKAELSEWLLI